MDKIQRQSKERKYDGTGNSLKAELPVFVCNFCGSRELDPEVGKGRASPFRTQQSNIRTQEKERPSRAGTYW